MIGVDIHLKGGTVVSAVLEDMNWTERDGQIVKISWTHANAVPAPTFIDPEQIAAVVTTRDDDLEA